MSITRNIIRTILMAFYVALIAFITFGIGALYSYLNTGADRSKMLHTEIKKIDQYLPEIVWSPLENEGRLIDEQTLKKIENDYLDAWYVKLVAYNTGETTGIKDYYTESARENIFNFVSLNKEQKIHLESTTLEHHPSLEFFSEDGQLAVITDRNVKEYKRLYKKETFLLETNETATYKVILLLEDGFWRIRHLVKEAVAETQNTSKSIDVSNLDIKGINYYPKASPWDMFGDKFSLDVVSKDFKIIKDAGLNTIRIFVPYEDFGKANIDSSKLKKLIRTLNVAESNNLKVIVTLFDFYGDYSVLDWTLNERHAEAIVLKLKDHKALLAWDIKNEPNLDFDSRGKEKVMAWLSNMTDFVKSVDTLHAVTIGWSNTESASLLKNKVDFVSFHYYEDIDKLQEQYKQLKTKIVNKPIVLGEYGLSSYRGIWNPLGNSEQNQAEYHKKVQGIFAKNNISFISWTLYDFTEIPKEVVGRLPWRKRAQEHFGFINQNGETKPAFKYISKP